ncbi:hypothetical protein [Cryobacterium sp. Y57]|uniref:hypothetical protein n=1 Tax=Cryobacterium sp. Y57 TaxID=2048287 RepID=UPI0011B027E6|nr:hypothetical protein [Cryobacterium sp. Y57]
MALIQATRERLRLPDFEAGGKDVVLRSFGNAEELNSCSVQNLIDDMSDALVVELAVTGGDKTQ